MVTANLCELCAERVELQSSPADPERAIQLAPSLISAREPVVCLDARRLKVDCFSGVSLCIGVALEFERASRTVAQHIHTILGIVDQSNSKLPFRLLVLLRGKGRLARYQCGTHRCRSSLLLGSRGCNLIALCLFCLLNPALDRIRVCPEITGLDQSWRQEQIEV